MLIPASFYLDEINYELNKCKYDKAYMFYDIRSDIKLADDSSVCHQFASVASNKKLVGYIDYDIDRKVGTVYNFSIINFMPKFRVVFARDVMQAVDDIFNKYNLHAIQFACRDGNPAKKIYDKFISKYGGRYIGYFNYSWVGLDGKIRSSHYYEISFLDYKYKLLDKNSNNDSLKAADITTFLEK